MSGIELIREVVTEAEGTYEWLHILGAFWELFEKKEFASGEIEVLRLASVFEGTVKLVHCFDGPHSAAPDEMIRKMAGDLLSRICNEAV